MLHFFNSIFLWKTMTSYSNIYSSIYMTKSSNKYTLKTTAFQSNLPIKCNTIKVQSWNSFWASGFCFLYFIFRSHSRDNSLWCQTRAEWNVIWKSKLQSTLSSTLFFLSFWLQYFAMLLGTTIFANQTPCLSNGLRVWCNNSDQAVLFFTINHCYEVIW